MSGQLRRITTPHPAHPRGVVLLLVIGAIAILSILAVELAHRANLDMQRAERTAREAAFRRVIDAGLEIASGLIAEGRPNPGFDAPSDPWSRTKQAVLGTGERVTVKLSDESGKLNLAAAMGAGSNAAKARKSLARLLAYLEKFDDVHAQQWRDIDNALRQRLGVDSKDVAAPLFTLDGLREAGIPREFVFGKPTADVTASVADHPMLCDLLTIYGDGRVNLNTAPAAVLYSLDEQYNEELVSQIEAWRGNPNADGQGVKPFADPKDLELVSGIVQRATVDGQTQVTSDLYLNVQGSVCVQSKAFSVRIVAEVNGVSRLVFGYFDAASSGTASPVKLLAVEEVEP